VDGGYVNNLPVDVARSYADIVIAVDVEDKDNSSMKDIFNYGDGVSGWWILWQRIISRKRFPVSARLHFLLSLLHSHSHFFL
jgi:predicted acylesterase/phospholipase RssA